MSEQLEARRLMSVSATGLSPSGIVNISKPYVVASFTTADVPQKATNYSASVDFNDGTSGKATVKLARGVFSVTAPHKYQDPGAFAAQVTINDKLDSTSQTVTSSINVIPRFTANGFTKIRISPAQYFQLAFGGTWTKKGTLNFKNRSLTATRVADGKDINWSGNVVSASAVGAFSISTQTFGYFPGTSGGSFVRLFDVAGVNTNASGGIGATAISGAYRLGRTGNNGNVISSNPGNNTDRRDHMITYAITGLAGQPANQKTYIVFFEDSPGQVNLFDFNDLIVELTLAS